MGSTPESREAWSWSEQYFAPVDLAVHALVRDGLGVPPFDAHPDGDGTLRGRGLTAENWRGWLAALVALHAEMRGMASTPPGERAIRRWDVPAGLSEPWALCPGSEDLRTRLREILAEPPRPAELADPIDAVFHGKPVIAPTGGSSAQRRLWRDLATFADRLPSLSVLLVHYPVAAVMPLPPTTCVVAPAPNAEGYADQLRAAARMLADMRDT